ncbi:MAG: diaminopimelate epimerase [Phycisphaerales bacterium]|nr:diaminopimelate epimerase [Phycisphaerales bacterium]
MRFSKMHGIGNDYIYVDGGQEVIEDAPTLARAVSDRHTGIGGDGLILILPASVGSGAHARMRIFNADGSEAQMCGNGIRCVTKFVIDRGISSENPLRIETGRGVLEMGWWVASDGLVNDVEVDMGAPILAAGAMGVCWPGSAADAQIVARAWPDAMPSQGAEIEQCATVISMGNPHIIFWCRDVSRVALEVVGPLIERHSYFPQRINVHFVEVLSRVELRMRTWERGSGVTLACGTGASAVCVAGVLEGRSERAVCIHLPGGDLSVRWDAQDGRVRMRGSATHVFDGEFTPQSARVLHAAE